MANPGLIKSYSSALAIPAYTIVKFDTSDTSVAAAAAATDKLLGVTTEVASSAGGTCDVIVDDIAYVKLGGNVTRGDFITSDGNGNGVVCNPAAGATARHVGVVQQSGVAGDIVNVLIQLGQLTTPA